MTGNRLSRFELLAQRIIEGSFSRLLGGRLQLVDVANRLAHAMEDSQEDGRVANVYQVRLHPDDYELLHQEHLDLQQQLADYLAQLAFQAGLFLPESPLIVLTADETAGRQQVLVQAEHNQPEEESTLVRRWRQHDELAQVSLQELDAFLIIEGKRHFPLDRPLITLGRRRDNDIVIDSPTVSRQHAQIRWRYGRFVIYDLGSRSGTLVNGVNVTESVLQPGDIITLSDVSLIYGEGTGRRRRSSSNGDDQTLILPRDNS